MKKLEIISRGISKRIRKDINPIAIWKETGIYEVETPYNIVELNFELSEVGAEIDSAMKKVADELVKYYKKNGAKNIEIKNCWSASDKVYNGVVNKEYYAGWIEIHMEKQIKNLNTMVNNLDKKAEEILEKVCMEMAEVEEIKFNPELTAIDTRNSKSAEIVAEIVQPEEKVVDYGCGTGRNIKYIKNNSNAQIVDGCDIVEQLHKQYHKHEEIKKDGKTVIEPSERLPENYYNIAINSHVLNVIESDEVKKMVVADIFKKLVEGGKAVIEVRTKSDVEGAKTKEAHGDGWKIKKGNSFTYQEGITKEKMAKLVTSVGFKIQEHTFNNSKHIVVAVK